MIPELTLAKRFLKTMNEQQGYWFVLFAALTMYIEENKLKAVALKLSDEFSRLAEAL